MDENGEPTPETNFGTSYQANGILAPGKNLMAAHAGGGTFITNGATSYATPVVSGVIALLVSLQISRGFPPDPYVIKSILKKTAIPCISNGKNDCRRSLQGKLNIPGVLEMITRNPGILAAGFEHSLPKKYTAMESNFLNETDKTLVGSNLDTIGPSCNHHHDEHETPIANDSDEPEDPDRKTGKRLAEEKVMCSSGSAIDSSGKIVPDINPSGGGPTVQRTVTQQPLSIHNLLKSGNMENVITSQKRKINTVAAVDSHLSVGPSGEIDPSCGCGCGGAGKVPPPPAIVYALGTIGYDFGSESHRDSFTQSMGEGRNPHNPADLIAYLRANPWAASELLWTLNIDATPIYALYPTGPYSNVVYERILASLEEQQNGNIQRVSVPGVAEGTTTLLNGQTVSNLYPNIRGMYSWTTAALVASAAAGETGESRVLAENVSNFLNRIYYKMRNLGLTAEERALNYSATNAYQVSAVFSSAMAENLELDDIVATKSPICRPGSDCYDVVLTFFNPRERLTQARREYRFTVDVSDVVPVTVGEVRSWSVY
jgi:cyanobactin maturation PatA/PatG family protease